MLDCFTLLGQPRRPWLDPETLKTKFLDLSARVHPDRVHHASAAEKQAAHARYTDLNTAYNCLREPRDRLRHLIELEIGTRPADIQQIPQDLVDLFMEVSRLSQEADSTLKDQAALSSPLLKLQFFERAQMWIEKLSLMKQRLSGHTERLLVELKSIDDSWMAMSALAPEARQPLLQRLEQLYPLFGYFGRWNAQLQERIVRFSL